jgi:uncharacterized protein (TIGR02186 family)
VPEAPPDIAVVVRGPSAPVTVRQKERIAGIWVNATGVRFESVPGFYAVSATRPITQIADERTTAIYEIGIRNLQLSPASGADDGISRTFETGLIAARQKAGLFTERSDGVQITRGVLYAARIALPAAVPVGDYTAEIHLVRKGRVLASTSAPFVIDKSGFERWVYVMAQENSLAYGLAAVMAALAAGADVVVMLHPDYQYTPRLVTAMAAMIRVSLIASWASRLPRDSMAKASPSLSA